MKITLSYIDKKTKTHKKLSFIKLLKEISGLNLKDAKNLVDILNDSDNFSIDIKSNINKLYFKNKFNDIGVNIIFNNRKEKFKRILYSDQKILMFDMLNEKWENYVDKDNFEKLTYNKCKEIGIKNIIKKYEKYFNSEFFTKIYNEIHDINQIENKNTDEKILKFNEEFGEFNAEYLKFKGLTYKNYNQENLLEEMADTLQVLLSIFDSISEKTNIKFSNILEKIMEKNIKWKDKINDYNLNQNNS